MYILINNNQFLKIELNNKYKEYYSHIAFCSFEALLYSKKVYLT